MQSDAQRQNEAALAVWEGEGGRVRPLPSDVYPRMLLAIATLTEAIGPVIASRSVWTNT